MGTFLGQLRPAAELVWLACNEADKANKAQANAGCWYPFYCTPYPSYNSYAQTWCHGATCHRKICLRGRGRKALRSCPTKRPYDGRLLNGVHMLMIRGEGGLATACRCRCARFPGDGGAPPPPVHCDSPFCRQWSGSFSPLFVRSLSPCLDQEPAEGGGRERSGKKSVRGTYLRYLGGYVRRYLRYGVHR